MASVSEPAHPEQVRHGVDLEHPKRGYVAPLRALVHIVKSPPPATPGAPEVEQEEGVPAARAAPVPPLLQPPRAAPRLAHGDGPATPVPCHRAEVTAPARVRAHPQVPFGQVHPHVSPGPSPRPHCYHDLREPALGPRDPLYPRLGAPPEAPRVP